MVHLLHVCAWPHNAMYVIHIDTTTNMWTPRCTIMLYCRCFRLMPFNANFSTLTTCPNKNEIQNWMYSWREYVKGVKVLCQLEYHILMVGQYKGDSRTQWAKKEKKYEIFQLVAIHMPFTRISPTVIHTFAHTRKKWLWKRTLTINVFTIGRRWRWRRRRPKPTFAICFTINKFDEV